MTHGSLFSGIGGFDLAAEWMGWENIFHCEWNSFGQKVLKYHFPNSISYEDITKTDFTIHRGRIDILTGGFPCQPYSMAGKRLGKEDERHLWPEMLRAIREIQPRWVVGENVLGLVNWSGGLVFHEVQADLEAEGYEVQPYVLPACAVNAPHRRDRVWFVAYASGNGHDAEPSSANNAIGKNNKQPRTQRKRTAKRFSDEWPTSDTNSKRYSSCGEGQDIERDRSGNNGESKKRSEKTEWSNGLLGLQSNASNTNCSSSQTWTQRQILGQSNWEKANGHSNVECTNQWQNFPTVSPICNGNDGLSDRLDGITFSKWRNESIKAGGNAIGPQVVYQIFKAIEEYETQAIPR